jgi:hypothetical protein
VLYIGSSDLKSFVASCGAENDRGCGCSEHLQQFAKIYLPYFEFWQLNKRFDK